MKRIIFTFVIGLATALTQGQAAAEATKAYAPGLGEIMMATQVRHAKLWLAGSARNWDLADYQIDELKEGLEDAVKYVPNYRDMPIGAMIENLIMPPIAQVEDAIKARNSAKFASAYAELTAACNACHEGTKRGFIVILRPTASAYPNQSFPPKRK